MKGMFVAEIEQGGVRAVIGQGACDQANNETENDVA
jgi:hypothetical protein